MRLYFHTDYECVLTSIIDAFDEPDQYKSTTEPLPDATGPPLLDDSDSHLLNDFFSNPDSFDVSSSLLHSGGNGKDEPTCDNSWAYTLPPSFKGASTELTAPGQHSQPTFEFTPKSSNPYANTSNSSVHHSTTDDVLGAASTLFNSFQTGSSHLTSDAAVSNVNDLPPLESSDTPNLGSGGYALVTSPQGQRLAQHAVPSLRGSAAIIPTAYSPQFRFLAPGTSQVSPSTSDQYADFRKFYKFGSDGNFSLNGYNLPPRQETEEEITKRLLQDMKAMRQYTPSNTQPSSPKLKFTARKPLSIEHSFTNKLVAEQHEKHTDDAKSDVKSKRRKHGANASEEESEPESLTGYQAQNQHSSMTKMAKGRKASDEGYSNATVAAAAASSSSSPSVKRRKSQASTSQKASRENLTDEQKRNNHILSEQKRRNLIKQGFEDLHILVPELRSGNFSKSNVLVETAVFLENLVMGNEELAAKLGVS